MSEKNYSVKAWTVTYAGLAINLALGILYAWSVLKGFISQSIESGGAFAWDKSSLNDPYAVCCLAFALSMTFAGKIQDKKGPSFTARIGGILVGIGFVLASLTTNYYMWLLGFGLLGGIGIGFGYSAATPAALKWFPPSKTGAIAGIVVSGFGLAPVYIAPLSSFLATNYGLQNAMLIFGIAFFILVVGVSFLLKKPPVDFVPVEKEGKKISKSNTSENTSENLGAGVMLRTGKFYVMWIIFFIAAGCGLMIISNISGMAKASLGKSAFIAVAIMAIGNASGRIIAGIVSDKITRALTLFIILIFQCALMFISSMLLDKSATAFIIVLFATLIGFNYGTNLSLFPSFTKGYWGLKNFGLNYGILMSAWGIGGFCFSRLSQMIFANTGSYYYSFVIAGSALVLCIILSFFLFGKKKKDSVQQ